MSIVPIYGEGKAAVLKWLEMIIREFSKGGSKPKYLEGIAYLT